MSRHSKNCTATAVFTSGERKKLQQYGTVKQRLGTESQNKFSDCSLCLSRAIEPRSCNLGHIYCKDCIMDNLINQKKKFALNHD